MRIVVVLALVWALAVFAPPPAVAGGQRSWWDVGPGSPVDSDFALGLTYSPVCVELGRLEAGPDAQGVYEMWRAAAEGTGAVLPGGTPCSYGAGVRFEGVHWLGPAVAFRAAVEGAGSWDVEEFPAPERVWRFRRCGVDLGVRFGRALGVVRPWIDVGRSSGPPRTFRRVRLSSPRPSRSSIPATPRSTSCSTCRAGVPSALRARSARVWTSGGGTAFGSPSTVRRSWPLLGPRFGSPQLAGAGLSWEVGPVIRF